MAQQATCGPTTQATCSQRAQLCLTAFEMPLKPPQAHSRCRPGAASQLRNSLSPSAKMAQLFTGAAILYSQSGVLRRIHFLALGVRPGPKQRLHICRTRVESGFKRAPYTDLIQLAAGTMEDGCAHPALCAPVVPCSASMVEFRRVSQAWIGI